MSSQSCNECYAWKKLVVCKMFCNKRLVLDSVEETTGRPLENNRPKVNLTQSDAMKLLDDHHRVSTLNEILRRYNTNINHIHLQNKPLIVWASTNCSHSLVKLLLEKGADPKLRCDEGKTGLYHAVKAGCTYMIELFLKYGCNVNGIVDGLPYLHHAVMACHGEATKCLLHYGANVNAEADDGPILLKLRSDRQLDIFKLLVSHGLDSYVRQGLRTAAEIFIKSGQLELLHQLLKFQGIILLNFTEYEYFGRSMLHVATSIQNFNCVAYLLSIKHDVNMCDVITGDTPLHIAARKGNVQLINILLSNGAWLYVENYEEDTALDLAKVAGHEDAVMCLKLWQKIGSRKNHSVEYRRTNMLRCYNRHCLSTTLIGKKDDYLKILQCLETAEKVARQEISEPIKEDEEKYLKEIKEMKAYELYPGISCFSLLGANKRILAAFTVEFARDPKNNLIDLYYKNLSEKFPCYQLLIWKRIMIGVRYAPIFSKARASFEVLFNYTLPVWINEMIMEFLSAEDIENVIKSVK